MCCDYLKNDLWLFRLEYLTEIYGQLNRLNSSMQGRNENIFTSTDKLVAFTKKVTLWKSRAKAGTLDMFPLVRKSFVKEMMPIIVEHLTCLEMRVEEYFPSINIDEFDWIRNPFVRLTDSSNFALCKEAELASSPAIVDLELITRSFHWTHLGFLLCKSIRLSLRKTSKCCCSFLHSTCVNLDFLS